VAEKIKITKSRDFFVTETRNLNKNGCPYGAKKTERRELEPWESWALDMLSRYNNGNRKRALLSLIPILVGETCETLLRSGMEGSKVTDMRFKLVQEYKDDLLSRLGETAADSAVTTREGMD
jgi:hypothetical protein